MLFKSYAAIVGFLLILLGQERSFTSGSPIPDVSDFVRISCSNITSGSPLTLDVVAIAKGAPGILFDGCTAVDAAIDLVADAHGRLSVVVFHGVTFTGYRGWVRIIGPSKGDQISNVYVRVDSGSVIESGTHAVSVTNALIVANVTLVLVDSTLRSNGTALSFVPRNVSAIRFENITIGAWDSSIVVLSSTTGSVGAAGSVVEYGSSPESSYDRVQLQFVRSVVTCRSGAAAAGASIVVYRRAALDYGSSSFVRSATFVGVDSTIEASGEYAATFACLAYSLSSSSSSASKNAASFALVSHTAIRTSILTVDNGLGAGAIGIVTISVSVSCSNISAVVIDSTATSIGRYALAFGVLSVSSTSSLTFSSANFSVTLLRSHLVTNGSMSAAGGLLLNGFLYTSCSNTSLQAIGATSTSIGSATATHSSFAVLLWWSQTISSSSFRVTVFNCSIAVIGGTVSVSSRSTSAVAAVALEPISTGWQLPVPLTSAVSQLTVDIVASRITINSDDRCALGSVGLVDASLQSLSNFTQIDIRVLNSSSSLRCAKRVGSCSVSYVEVSTSSYTSTRIVTVSNISLLQWDSSATLAGDTVVFSGVFVTFISANSLVATTSNLTIAVDSSNININASTTSVCAAIHVWKYGGVCFFTSRNTSTSVSRLVVNSSLTDSSYSVFAGISYWSSGGALDSSTISLASIRITESSVLAWGSILAVVGGAYGATVFDGISVHVSRGELEVGGLRPQGVAIGIGIGPTAISQHPAVVNNVAVSLCISRINSSFVCAAGICGVRTPSTVRFANTTPWWMVGSLVNVNQGDCLNFPMSPSSQLSDVTLNCARVGSVANTNTWTLAPIVSDLTVFNRTSNTLLKDADLTVIRSFFNNATTYTADGEADDLRCEKMAMDVHEAVVAGREEAQRLQQQQQVNTPITNPVVDPPWPFGTIPSVVIPPWHSVTKTIPLTPSPPTTTIAPPTTTAGESTTTQVPTTTEPTTTSMPATTVASTTLTSTPKLPPPTTTTTTTMVPLRHRTKTRTVATPRPLPSSPPTPRPIPASVPLGRARQAAAVATGASAAAGLVMDGTAAEVAGDLQVLALAGHRPGCYGTPATRDSDAGSESTNRGLRPFAVGTGPERWILGLLVVMLGFATMHVMIAVGLGTRTAGAGTLKRMVEGRGRWPSITVSVWTLTGVGFGAELGSSFGAHNEVPSHGVAIAAVGALAPIALLILFHRMAAPASSISTPPTTHTDASNPVTLPTPPPTTRGSTFEPYHPQQWMRSGLPGALHWMLPRGRWLPAATRQAWGAAFAGFMPSRVPFAVVAAVRGVGMGVGASLVAAPGPGAAEFCRGQSYGLAAASVVYAVLCIAMAPRRVPGLGPTHALGSLIAGASFVAPELEMDDEARAWLQGTGAFVGYVGIIMHIVMTFLERRMNSARSSVLPNEDSNAAPLLVVQSPTTTTSAVSPVPNKIPSKPVPSAPTVRNDDDDFVAVNNEPASNPLERRREGNGGSTKRRSRRSGD